LAWSPPEDETHGKGKQARAKPLKRNRGALTVSGLDLETKIFSASGRGRGFFLTSLFIELIDPRFKPTKRAFLPAEASGTVSMGVNGLYLIVFKTMHIIRARLDSCHADLFISG
jgi:hypothetical protein